MPPHGKDLDREVREFLASSRFSDAAAAVVAGCGPAVRGYLGASFEDPDEVDDCHSEWSENVLRGIPGFRGDASVRTWALRLACNVAISRRRKAGRRHERRLRTEEASVLAGEQGTRTFARHELRRQRLLEARRGLSPQEQALLFLRVDQSLSWEEVAEILSEIEGKPIDPATAARRYGRLKERLRKLLDDDESKN